jgi:hypothetical protein
MDCATWPIWAMLGAGVLFGAGIASGITIMVMGRIIEARDDIIDELVWQQGQFEQVFYRGETRH